MALPTNDMLELFRAIIDIESVSRNERELADSLEQTLIGFDHLEVLRDGDAVMARTNLGRAERVLIAGHIDTVPVAGNLPSQLSEGPKGTIVHGRGSCDMKGGVAVMVWLAERLVAPERDITWVFYDCEEIDYSDNGMGRLVANHADWFDDISLAVLMEPTDALIEGGCQGTTRFGITTHGVAAHSARSWFGHNAIHDMARVIDRTAEFAAAEIEVDGLMYHEGLNVTMISGGLAANVVPDSCTAQINYRFAPDKTAEQAIAIMREWFADWELDFYDITPGARPGLQLPATAGFVAAVGSTPRAKFGWTDVGRFAALGMPAINFGPGDPNVAHKVDEHCPLAHLEFCADALTRWLAPAMCENP